MFFKGQSQAVNFTEGRHHDEITRSGSPVGAETLWQFGVSPLGRQDVFAKLLRSKDFGLFPRQRFEETIPSQNPFEG